MTRRIVALLVSLNLIALVAPGAAAGSWQPTARGIRQLHTGTDYRGGRMLPVASGASVDSLTFSSSSGPAQIGDKKKWFTIDDAEGSVFWVPFKLRGKGRSIEVWVRPTLSFPAGDCRNDERVQVTNDQIQYLIDQFDNNIFPKESSAFSRPPDRDGSKARASDFVPVGGRYYRGAGDKIVVLVDNVRDDNYYDLNDTQNHPYIIGFFYSVFNELTDRNVMTIDGYDWIHRTRENPPHEPDPVTVCNSKPARPFLIEETFAHEYQHLLEYYEDRNETVWVNEGLADWAQTLTGYAHPERSIDELGFDRHVQCFLGYCGVPGPNNPRPSDMGPENSLTVWEDQGDPEILADYGAAYTFMELLHSRYGNSFMKKLHRNNGNGMASLSSVLTNVAAATTAAEVVSDWAAAMALDGILDGGAVLTGADPARLLVKRLNATINWDTTHAYSTPGAPPNGSDYVRLRDSAESFLSAANINSITFDGTPPAGTNFVVQLVAYDAAGTGAWLGRLALDASANGTVSGAELDALIGTTADTVAAIVTLSNPTENVTSYGSYQLTVDGVQQPGGV